MSFATEVVKDGRGRALRLDISFDRFATITHRYGTVAGLLDGTNMYEPYLKSVGSLTRGFGTDRIVSPAQLDAIFTNTHGECDWMVNVASYNDVRKARIRLYLVIYDPRDLTGNVTKQLGEFVFPASSHPVRTLQEVRAQMADDVLGTLLNAVTLPSFENWRTSVNSTSSNCPLLAGGEFLYFDQDIGKDEPIPLAWGGDWIEAILPGIPQTPTPGGDYEYKRALTVCVTADDTLTDHNIEELRFILGTSTVGGAEFASPVGGTVITLGGTEINNSIALPRQWTWSLGHGLPDGTYTMWEEKVSTVTTVGGIDFKVLYVLVDIRLFYQYTFDTFGGISGRPLPGPGGWLPGDGALATPSSWWVKGYPLSGIAVQDQLQQHPADVIRDICGYYTKGSDPSRVDDTSFDRVKASTPTAHACGVIGTNALNDLRKQTRQGTMRGELIRLCQSADMDLFVNWSGQFALSCDLLDFNLIAGTDGLLSIPETRIAKVSERVPSKGERGFPFNRVYLEGGTESPVENIGLPHPGPFDNTTLITAYDSITEVTLQQGWRPRSEQSYDPFLFRQIDNRIRPRITFQTDLEVIASLDLGDIFIFNWTRGADLGTPYSGAYFQVEKMTYSQEGDVVEIEALYKDDLSSVAPYLLDNESLIIRVSSGGGRFCTVEDGNSEVTFNGGSLVTDDVHDFDHLVLLDATQDDTTFSRFRALQIQTVTSDTTLEVAGDLDFDAPTPVNVNTWEIRRSYRGYPTAGEDPTNYPSGSTMYGKVSSATEPPVYSDASVGNRLTNG